MSEAERTPPSPAQLETQKWVDIVAQEVASIKLQTKTKVAADIARVWANNRQKIKMSKENQVEPPGALEPIPMMSLSRDTSSNSSSGEDGEKKKRRRRDYVKVVSEKTK